MPFTNAQTTLFFEEETQMGIPHDTVVHLAQEGIAQVQDLEDFDKESIAQIAANLRRPGGRIQDRMPQPGC
jgi:hypothetical protein